VVGAVEVSVDSGAAGLAEGVALGAAELAAAGDTVAIDRVCYAARWFKVWKRN
jgi:hypothetical protein